MKFFSDPAEEGTPRAKLSDTLARLSEAFGQRTMTLQEVMDELGPQATALLVVFITVPFCAPITVPGAPTPSGIISMWLVGRYALGLKPWLPKRLLARKLAPKFFSKAFKFAAKFIGWLEKSMRPRWRWVLATDVHMRMHALGVFLSALLLALPMPPLPLTNTIPAIAIVVGMLALIERDGLAMIIAWCITLLALAYFTAIAVLGVEAFDGMLDWFRSK